MGNGNLEGTREADRRRAMRYDIRLPVELTFSRGGNPAVITARTKDVSDEGAFLVTNTLLPPGTHVDLELQLQIDGLLRLIGSDRIVHISTDGTVVRNEHHGLAVTFGRTVSLRPK